MGLFSFGSKEDKRDKRVSRQRSSSADKMSNDGAGVSQDALLDPMLPEKQRARRRLIGALVLIVAAIVILPMVLDSQPKPAPDDIAIQIPKSLFESCNEGPQGELGASYNSLCEASVTHIPQAPKQAGNAFVSAAPALANNSQVQRESTKPNTEARQPTAPKTSAAIAASAPTPSSNAKLPPRPTSTAASMSGRFVIQLMALSDEQRAQSWVKRLKQANVPAYLERKQQNNRSELWLVRAGPFNDRAIAEAALKRLREAGFPLSSKASQTLQQN